MTLQEDALLTRSESLVARWERRPLQDFLAEASALRHEGHGRIVSYSRKVFAPLTHLCRDVCAYCTFAKQPGGVKAPYMSIDEVVALGENGNRVGCHELLFTLGDKPELRYSAAARWLEAEGYKSTYDYLTAAAGAVLKTGLLPHINAGVMTRDEMAALKAVSASQGLMLESISSRLCERGGPHFGSPDKDPAVRLAMIDMAGQLAIPFTTGILIGIGETRVERIASLLAIKELHERYGHIQEVIVQNFRAKPGTRMAAAADPDMDDMLWTIAAARLILGPEMNIQAPPNLSYEDFPRLLSAGINDWGGVSPLTPDFVNPEAPWPSIARLERETALAGYQLVARLPVYPEYALSSPRWQAPAMVSPVLASMDMEGFARDGRWAPGTEASLPPVSPFINIRTDGAAIGRLIARATAGERLDQTDVVRLFRARGDDAEDIAAAADELRRNTVGDVVRYVVNRNINYTNVCYYKCSFCAFSKGKTHDHLRGKPYDLAHEEVQRRAVEAWDRGATEVCMQGGINPDYTGETYVALLRAVKAVTPGMHVHAFSPLEIAQGAATLDIPVEHFLGRLRDEGLGSLPGTAAEILDDEVRRVLCPDKINTEEWLDVVGTAHRVGIRTTATIMFGHMEAAPSWARHILSIRDLQERTGGFTEFVPLPFVHFEAPMYLRGTARRGPTWRETVLMYAVSRLVLHPLIPNIQTSWVKLGPVGVAASLKAGVNDLGGTLMNESISRAAGTQHGQELPPEEMDALIRKSGRIPAHRTTLYGEVDAAHIARSYAVAPLTEPVQTPLRARQRAVH